MKPAHCWNIQSQSKKDFAEEQFFNGRAIIVQDIDSRALMDTPFTLWFGGNDSNAIPLGVRNDTLVYWRVKTPKN